MITAMTPAAVVLNLLLVPQTVGVPLPAALATAG
jgi:hypothetical protein